MQALRNEGGTNFYRKKLLKPGHILDLYCVRKNFTKLYFDATHLEKWIG